MEGHFIDVKTIIICYLLITYQSNLMIEVIHAILPILLYSSCRSSSSQSLKVYRKRKPKVRRRRFL
ncbi:hypothetical protein V6Z11_D05G215100 [Gossypium hirsutum]